VSSEPTDLNDTEEEMMKSIGALEEADEQLELSDCDELDIGPEEAGKWITSIGKAIVAIFKL